MRFCSTRLTVILMLLSFTSQAALSDPALTQKDDTKRPLSEVMWGQTPPNAIYFGMFTLHINPESFKDDRWNNNLIGGVYDGIFFGTLLNSFDNRAFVVGLGRDVYNETLSENFNLRVGYRLGVISGYDERMGDMAKYSPVIPFPQIYADLTWRKHLGFEFTYVGVVFTAGFYWTF